MRRAREEAEAMRSREVEKEQELDGLLSLVSVVTGEQIQDRFKGWR